MPDSLDDLKRHIGDSATATDLVTAAGIAKLAATLGVEPPASQDGEPIPVGWHTPFFNPIYGPERMREDGQQAGGGFMPAIPLPRQRLRGDRAVFHEPLRIGDALVRTSEVADIAIEEDPAAGPVVHLTQRHSISCPRGLAIVEERSFFFHGETAPAVESPAETLPDASPWRRVIDPDPVLLFRYSAVRLNSHRIHYDRDFAMGKEGLPGLVVHGTLISQLLLEMCRTGLAGGSVAEFAYRIVQPIYDTGPFTIAGSPAADSASADLWALDQSGALAMTATAALC